MIHDFEFVVHAVVVLAATVPNNGSDWHQVRPSKWDIEDLNSVEVVPFAGLRLAGRWVIMITNYTSIGPKQHKFQKNHMSALCHAHKFLWFPCMGLCSVMSIGLRLCFFLGAAWPPRCFQ